LVKESNYPAKFKSLSLRQKSTDLGRGLSIFLFSLFTIHKTAKISHFVARTQKHHPLGGAFSLSLAHFYSSS